MSRRNRSGVEIGHDAFLDIVANLVGILIILVVIMGTQSQQVLRQADQTPQSVYADDDQMNALATQAMRAASATADSNRFEATIKQYEAKTIALQQQRAMLLDLVAQARAAFEDLKRDLDADQVRQAALQTEQKSLTEKLANLQGQKEQIAGQAKPVAQMQHLPTPMAKTVFGEEIHFRLRGNRLSVVPIDQLLDEIRRDVQRNFGGTSEGLRDSAVGPVQGYIAKYLMDKDRATVSRGGRVGVSTRIQLIGFVVEPLEEPYGQTMDVVLSGRSQLDVELAGRDPSRTTVTVWVYEDSFAAFRKLKEHLYLKGFATAARPLQMDRKIIASSEGTRSSAQ